MAWFRREQTPLPPEEQESLVPEWLYIKCGCCKEILYRKEVLNNQSVCASAPSTSGCRPERLEMLCDVAWESSTGLVAPIPQFKDTNPYAARIETVEPRPA